MPKTSYLLTSYYVTMYLFDRTIIVINLKVFEVNAHDIAELNNNVKKTMKTMKTNHF